MAWFRVRALPILAVLCLAGQGFLLILAGNADPVPRLPWPAVFLLLVLPPAWAVARRRALPNPRNPVEPSVPARRRPWLIWGVLALLAGSAFVPVYLAGRVVPPIPDAADRQAEAALDRAQAALHGLVADVAAVADQAGTLAAGAGPAQGADLFLLAEAIGEPWRRTASAAGGFGLETVLWSGSERVAWTPGAEPLPEQPARQEGSGPDPGPTRLREGRATWFLQRWRILSADLALELQIPLPTDVLVAAVPGVTLAVRIPSRAEQLPRRSFGPGRTFRLAPGQDEPALRLLAAPAGSGPGSAAVHARLYLLQLVTWVLALAAVLRRLGGPAAFLAALWTGRAVLAGVDLFRWIGPAFPDQVFPAGPRSLLSLVDPAYFATPFAFGWFASTADALVTAGLMAFTVWRLLARRDPGAATGDRGTEDPTGDGSRGARPALGLPGNLLSGLVVGGVLLGIRFLVGVIAANANARLIGTGVSLSSLSFWGLQLVLMLMALVVTSLVTAVACGPFRTHGRGPWGWVIGAGLAAAGALLATTPFPALGWAHRLTLAVLAAGLWLPAPAARAGPQFMRSLAWPGMLLLAVAWNYSSLREVYDAAERSWLQRKADLITEANEEWTRFLLGSVLQDMALQESGDPAGASGADIWRDEPAWRLWRDSALRDLGYSCQVELLDPEGREESFIALGFLRDLQYEVARRSPWSAQDGGPAQESAGMIFQTENRLYAGGEEIVMAGEIARAGHRGWIRVEVPLRSWRISTLKGMSAGGESVQDNQYRPRAEVDRPILLLRGDASGWLDAGGAGFPAEDAAALVAKLKAGLLGWADLAVGTERWLCLWKPLSSLEARSPGEGYLIGLQRPRWSETLLDLSRLMLLNLVLLFLLAAAIRLPGRLGRVGRRSGAPMLWRPGFQERFLAGYLLLGMVLLLVVGMSVDRVGYRRVQGEAREQTRAGMALGVQQLRSLMVEQARSLAGSQYIADLLVGQLSGSRPAGPSDLQQAMVFAADGTLLLDETLSDLTDEEARALLAAGRSSPFVVVRDGGELYVAAVIPIRLGDVPAGADAAGGEPGHAPAGSDGFFMYRQRLDPGLLSGLADLVRGQANLSLGGVPVLASHPAVVFSGQSPQLTEPAMMAALLDHPGSPGVFTAPGRPFAFTGATPLPTFERTSGGRWVASRVPAVLAMAFPDREREYIAQRMQTILFLTGLANLILLTALLLAVFMSWRIFRPLRLLADATRSLARGDFTAPLPEPGGDEVGSLSGAFGTMRGQLHTAREELAARERFLAAVLDRVTVGVAVLDRDGGLAVLNPAGRGIIGQFRPDVPAAAGVQDLRRAFQGMAAGAAQGVGELRSPAGGRTLRGAMAPLALPDGRTDTLLVFEDITEFLENKKMALNAELARQVAHEIKNPLTPIQLSVQLLGQAWRDKHPDLDALVPATVERVLAQVALLRSIASEFSLLGRPDKLQTQAVDLPALTAQVVAAYATGGASPGIAAEQEGVPQIRLQTGAVPPALAHPESLQKILGNLMQNSLDAAVPGRNLQVGVGWVWDDGTVTMRWQDNGAGLSAEVAEHLFDPYFSTKSKGTGLGLAICRSLADRMGGTITLANRGDGPGTVAALTLPRVPLPPQS